MSERVSSIAELPRWSGHFPGEHEFSTLEGMNRDSQQNPELEIFFDAAHRLVNCWKGNKFAGLLLYGNPGTGKTHAAIGLGRALHDAGADVFYQFVPGIVKGQLRWDTERAPGVETKYSAVTSAFTQSRDKIISGQHHIVNPKSVLILDDYRPERQAEVAAAVEAGAQFGGLVIMTSNYNDPFKIVETRKALPENENDALAQTVLERDNPQLASALENEKQNKLHEVSASLRSRIAAGFKIVNFTGPDQRMQNSFWAD